MERTLANLEQEMVTSNGNHPVYRDRTIAPDVFIHYSILHNPECEELLRDLGVSDMDALLNDLLDFILEGTTIPNRNTRDPLDNIYDQVFPGARGPINVRPAQNRVIKTPIFETILQEAKDIEEIMNGHTQDKYPSYRSFLKAFFIWANREEQTHVFIILTEHGLSLEDLMAESDSGENILEELCTNLNKEAEAGRIDEVIGRDKEILEVVKTLGKRKKSNAVLLGKAGVGKTAIAEGLAKMIVDGKIPHTLENAVIYSLNTADMSAGTQYRGQFEEKLRNLIDEFIRMTEEGKYLPILFIDEIHTIVGAGASGGGSSDFANIIKPELANGRLRCIGATTETEWNQFIKQSKALARRFDRINIYEPSRDETIQILKSAKKYYEEKHGITYTDESIVAAVDLADKYMTNVFRPDKALDLFDYCGSAARVSKEETVNLESVEKSISIKKNIPLARIQAESIDEEKAKHKPISPQLKEVIFGQDHIVENVAKIVERSLAGLSEENKPIGSFLFLGPTGVGKTETAKQLSRILDCHFMRIDMSEFMEKHTISGLIGAPAGYIGYGEVPRLAEINDNPHCVLLLDEVEKAHPDIQKLFLQALDNGSIKTRDGDTVSFENVIIMMTSNAGARERATKTLGLGALGKNQPKKALSDSKADKAIKNQFLPEFLGRINSKLTFNALTNEQYVKIVYKHVKNLNKTKACLTKNINLSINDKAANWIVSQNTSPELGARPIEDAVRNYILDFLTESLLYGELKDGDKNVLVTLKDNKLDFVVSDISENKE